MGWAGQAPCRCEAYGNVSAGRPWGVRQLVRTQKERVTCRQCARRRHVMLPPLCNMPVRPTLTLDEIVLPDAGTDPVKVAPPKKTCRAPSGTLHGGHHRISPARLTGKGSGLTTALAATAGALTAHFAGPIAVRIRPVTNTRDDTPAREAQESSSGWQPRFLACSGILVFIR
jgi:hypothetical protein